MVRLKFGHDNRLPRVIPRIAGFLLQRPPTMAVKNDNRTRARHGAKVTRRTFVRDAATGIGAIGLAGLGPLARVESRTKLPKPHKSGIEHVVVVMWKTGPASLPRLAADGRRPSGGAELSRQQRHRARDEGAGAGLSGLRASGSGSFLRWRAHRIQRRRLRRLAARRRERRVRDRLLHGAGPAVLRAGGAVLDDVRPLLRVDHGGNLSEPHLSDGGADRSPRELRRHSAR
jgi:hypothetical protein